MKLQAVLVAVFLQVAVGARVSYDGYKVYHVTPKTRAEADILRNLRDNPKYDYWLEPRALGVPATVMVAPDEQAKFEEKMRVYKLNTTVLIQNVEDTLLKESSEKSIVKQGRASFDRYLTVAEINDYLTDLAITYPKLVTLEELGESYQGFPLLALRISSGGTGKPAIFIDAGIHAREWIAPATALYVIQELVENATNTNLTKNIDWIVLPIFNPDGYTYSRTTDNLWRKTRSKTSNPTCPGVDGNRNFDYYWMEAGASSQPCAETFAGAQPFSEAETKAVGNYLQTHKQAIKLYLTFHSYGRYLLYPWGYDYVLPSNSEELYNVGIAVANEIQRVNGTKYTVGSSAIELYAAAGGSDDYALGAAGIDLAYTVELPEGGSWGFHPPENRILPIVKETFAGVREYHRYIEEKYVV